MAYPSVHKFPVNHVTAYCSSIGGTPVSTYIRVPFRCTIGLIDAVTHGVITTADCSVAVALNGTAIAGSPFIIPVASARRPAEVASLAPTSPVYANADDVIKITPSGASGATIAATFGAALVPA